MHNKIKKTMEFLGLAWEDRMGGPRDGEQKRHENGDRDQGWSYSRRPGV